MSKFKVGDRVVSHSDAYGITKSGWVGTVTKVYDGGRYIAAKGPGLNSTTGFTFLCVEDFDLYPCDPKIVVTTDGKTTQARLFYGKKCVKTAEAKLSDKDTFSFETGAAWALGRLLGRDLKKPAEPEPTKFDKALLVDGRFVYISSTGWGVILGEKILYKMGGWDSVLDLTSDDSFGLIGDCRRVEAVVEANCFNGAAAAVRIGGASVIWKRPGAKFD